MAIIYVEKIGGKVSATFSRPQRDNPNCVAIDDAEPAYVAWKAAAAAGKTCAEIDSIERARRGAGFVDTGAGGTGKTYQADPESIAHLAILGSGAPAGPFQIIAADNTIQELDGVQLNALIRGRIFPWVSATAVYARTMKNNVLAGLPPNAQNDVTEGWP